MGLYSLSALGADAAQLERFADSHWARLELLPAEPGPTIGAHAWKTRLGQRDAINAYRAFFTQAIARHGRNATLRKDLPDLLPGIGSGGFHALIRTGYGVRFGDDREVADGLAYWATAFVPLGPLGAAGTERDRPVPGTRAWRAPERASTSTKSSSSRSRMNRAPSTPTRSTAARQRYGSS